MPEVTQDNFLEGGSESLSQIRDDDNDNDNNNDKSSNKQILNGRKVTNIQGNGNICGESWGIECKICEISWQIFHQCEISLQNHAAGVIHLYWRELRKKNRDKLRGSGVEEPWVVKFSKSNWEKAYSYLYLVLTCFQIVLNELCSTDVFEQDDSY